MSQESTARPPSIKEEIKQSKPFHSKSQEALLALLRTADDMRHSLGRALEPAGVTLQQYNVLRILRGAGANGLCRNEIRDRLITRMPDVTRLLDRMEDARLVTRVRSTEDRRLVSTRLTSRGRDLVNSLDGPVATEHERRLGHLSKGQLRTLVELLTLVRREP
jgi:DNA-binding MarR family transcriptional regulator